jgi:hypothetical protein
MSCEGQDAYSCWMHDAYGLYEIVGAVPSTNAEDSAEARLIACVSW